LRKDLKKISVSDKVILYCRLKSFIPGNSDPDKLTMVLEVRTASDEMYRYFAVPATFFKPESNGWTDISLVVPLETNIPKDGYIKLYTWYTGKETVYIDDIEILVLDVNSNEN